MRVVIAEDTAVLRVGLVQLLGEEGYEVVAAVADGEALKAAVAQLHPDVVVADIRMLPWRLHGSGLTRSLALDLQPCGRLVSRHARMCGFVPMLGTTAHDDSRALQLGPDAVLRLDPRDPHDERALVRALTHPPHQHWTGIGVQVRPQEEPIEHLDLWLATHTTRFCRLKVTKAARERGLADPAYRWAGAGVYDGGTIAYVAMRPRDENSEELGVTAHGPDSDKLAATLLELLRQWDENRPAQPYITVHPADTPHEQRAPGTLISRPNTHLTVAW